ncbi:MAG: histidine kinase [Actinomycetota bacterium]
MLELLTDRQDFRKAVLIVALGFAVWSLAVSVDWGWIPASFVVVVLLVELVTGRLPDPALLVLTIVPTVIAESQDKGNVGWFVIVLLLAIVSSAEDIRPVTRVLIGATIAAPAALWVARVDDYVELGPWTWLSGLALGLVFGLVIGHLTRAIDELERSRALLAESTAREERQRIARELHDLVGHSFSVVLLHLAGARTTLASDPDRATAALADAETVGRKGMEDLREALALMRTDAGYRRPVESLDAVDPLIEQYRAAGLAVRVERDGPLDAVATGVGIVAYEVLREALTNAAKHAPDAVVDVELTAGETSVGVVISNDAGRAADGTGRGSGIDGLRQRVRSLGGSFDAGRSGGRWRVAAQLPRSAAVATDHPEVRA